MRNVEALGIACLYCIAMVGCSQAYGPHAQWAPAGTARSASQPVKLYDNGPDPGGSCDCPYFAVNFGYGVTDSFTLTHPAQLTELKLDVYTVNDENDPYAADWAITSEPFGGRVYASAQRQTLLQLGDPWYTRSGFIAFPEALSLPTVQLQPGTYWIQLK